MQQKRHTLRPPPKTAVTSGIRLGTAAATTRGLREPDFREVGQMIAEVVDGLACSGDDANLEVEADIRARYENCMSAGATPDA